MEDVLFLHDNARPHTSKETVAKLKQLEWETLKHPPYSPDLSPSDYHLFHSMKGKLRGQHFHSEMELINWLEKFFASKSADFYREGIEDLLRRWEEVIELEGDYVVD